MIKPNCFTGLSLLLLFVFTLSGCARIPLADVDYTYDPTINYSKFRTFAWYEPEVPMPSENEGAPYYTTLLDERVKAAVASELVKQGIKPTTYDKPDLLVAYDVAVDSSELIAQNGNLPPGYGYAYWFGYRYRYTYAGIPHYRSIERYAIGTLVIDLIDPDTNQLLWRGSVGADINPATLDASYISVVVANIMSQFPPTPDVIR